MAISGNVYSPKSFELLIAPQTTLGTAHTTSGDFRKYAVTSVSDIDFGSGLVADRTLRIGQQIKKNTDHYASQKGASCSFSFEWLVDWGGSITEFASLHFRGCVQRVCAGWQPSAVSL